MGMLEIIFQSILTLVVMYVAYEVIEVRGKQKLDTYWKIEAEYKSDAQQQARKYIEAVNEDITQQQRLKVPYDELVNYYNNQYHNSPIKEQKEMAWTIRTRLRFLNLCGVLLKKKMISKQLLFSLIGLGFEIDKPVLTIILDAHRKDHNAPALYNHMEYLWDQYLKWKNATPEKIV